MDTEGGNGKRKSETKNETKSVTRMREVDTGTGRPAVKEHRKITSGAYRTGRIVGNTVAGIGVGVIAGMGAIVAVTAAEVLVPAALVLKACGVTGGAVGFLRGIKKDNK